MCGCASVWVCIHTSRVPGRCNYYLLLNTVLQVDTAYYILKVLGKSSRINKIKRIEITTTVEGKLSFFKIFWGRQFLVFPWTKTRSQNVGCMKQKCSQISKHEQCAHGLSGQGFVASKTPLTVDHRPTVQYHNFFFPLV